MAEAYERSDGRVVVEEAVVVKERPKALLIQSYAVEGEFWVPKSAVHDDSEVWRAGQEAGDLVVEAWAVKGKGVV